MSLLSSLREAPSPAVAVEIAASHVTGAMLDWRGGAVVTAHVREPLGPGALAPSLTAANIHDRSAVVSAFRRVLEGLGRPRRIGLLVPDPVAKVSIVKFEQVPPRPQDLEQLIRWQIRKSSPFNIDEAQLGYVPGRRLEDGHEFIVTIARREVIEEYERVAADAGAHAGIVDLATFNVINTALAGLPKGAGDPGENDWLLVHVALDFATIVILRGSHPLFFRTRAAATDGTLGDLVHQTAMYYEDRLKGTGFARVMLAGGASIKDAHHGSAVEEIRRSLAERLATTVETVDPGKAATVSDRISPEPALLDALIPLVGLFVRGRGKAA